MRPFAAGRTLRPARSPGRGKSWLRPPPARPNDKRPALDMNSVVPLQPRVKGRDVPDQLIALVGDDIGAVEAVITRHAFGQEALIRQLAGHILDSGGKRLRPMLLLACARLCGYRGVAHHHLGACVEFLHTATLLHDDVVDGAFQRRGRQSANAVWGAKASILVGDFLLARSFRGMLEARSFDVLEVLSEAASTIAEGEIRQLSLLREVDISEQLYLAVIEAKTAALFAAACQIGALLPARPKAESEALRDYGLNFGIAYQLMDDLLDYGGGGVLWGKARGADFKEGKVTLPAFLAYRRGDPKQKDFWRRCLGDMDQKEGDLEKASTFIRQSGAGHDVLRRARHYAQIGRDSLGIFKDGPARRALLDAVDFSLRRQH